jgi:hypothetical protein
MSEFKPLNLAQLYQSADAAVGQAMQTNLLVLQSSRMKQEFDEEDALRTLARNSTSVGPDGAPSFDLKSFTKGAYSVNPMKAMAFEKAGTEAEKTALERAKLAGDVEKQRREGAAERLRLMGDAASVPFMKWKELTEKGVADEEARQQVQPLWEQGIRNLVGSGLFNEEQLSKMDLRRQFDPTVAETGHRQVLGAKGAMDEYWKVKEFGQKEKHHRDSLDVQIQGQKITIRGQDLTDQRSREQLAQSLLLGRLEIDKDRGVVFDKVSKQAWPMSMGGGTGEAGAGGQPLPPKGADVEGLRKEFNAREEVKNYNAAVPVLRAVSAAPDTAAGDLDLIYGVGKILDPGSVVREGEMALVMKTGSPLQQIIGTTRWSAEQGGRLTPKVRSQLMEALQGRVNELHQSAMDARKPFEAQAKRQNIPLDETLTLPELPKLGGKGAKGGKAATPPPAVGAVMDGYRFKGGDASKPESWEKVGS